MEKAKWTICGQTIEVSEFYNGLHVFEKLDEDERWFVCTECIDNTFYLQENLENGEIIDLGVFSSMVTALDKLARCGKMKLCAN